MLTELDYADRFEKLAEVIEANPDHFDMRWWGSYFSARGVRQVGTVGELLGLDLLASCGTSGCIAGWAVTLWSHEADDPDLPVKWAAAEILGLSDEETELFYMENNLDLVVETLRALAAQRRESF